MSSAEAEQALSNFDDSRRRMFGIAYRMLGSVAEAEDIVQRPGLVGSRPTGPRCAILVDS